MRGESGPEEPPNKEFAVKTVTNIRFFLLQKCYNLFPTLVKITIYKGQNEVKYGEKVPIFQKIIAPYIAHAGGWLGVW